MKATQKFTFILLLTLLTGACTMKPATQPSDDETILDAYWMLISVEGEDVPKPHDSRMAYIRFQETENDVFGYTGCNKFKGKYTLTDTSLRMSNLSSTRMSCTSMDTEKKLMDVLGRTTSYVKSGRVLTLYAGNKAIATFMTGTPEDMGLNLRDQ